jgi:hypothetical protein
LRYISNLHVVWKTWPVTWPGNCLKSSLRGNVCVCLNFVPVHSQRPPKWRGNWQNPRDMQSIPCYSVCHLLRSHHCVDALQIQTQDLVQLYSWVSFKCVEGFPPSEPTHSCLKLSQARDKSCEVLSSLTFHLLHLSPSMARLRAHSPSSRGLFVEVDMTPRLKPSLVWAPCLCIVCATCACMFVWLASCAS